MKCDLTHDLTPVNIELTNNQFITLRPEGRVQQQPGRLT
jgi:hypothetical protein